MQQVLKVSTAATTIVGPILDTSGAVYTGAVIGDLNITKNGTTAAMASAATLTHDHNGHYLLVFTTGNTDTIGRLDITCNKSTYAMPPKVFEVLAATAFDTLVTNGTLASTTSGRTIVTDAAGLVDANTVKLGPTGAGTAQTARDIGTSVLLSTGTGTGQLDFTSGVVKANATQWLGGTIPAVNVTGVPLVDAKYLLGTIFSTPATAGVIDVNVKNINNVAAATPGASGGLLISGSNSGTTTLGALTVTGATTLTGNVSMGGTFSTTGTVTFNAFTVTNATTLSGAVSLGSTLGVTGTTTLAALTTTGTMTVNAFTCSNAFTVTGTTTHTGNVSCAAGVTITQSTTNGAGLSITGNGTGAGILSTGGATGIGISAVGGSSSGSGIKAVGTAGNAIAVELAGQGSAAGLSVTGGATGAGVKFVGGGTSGAAFTLTTTSGDGLSITPTAGNAITATADGTSKHGFVITGGTGGTSDGLKAVAGTGGVPIRGNITANITGTVDTVTTVGTLTTYTGNTPQTGDSYARIGAAGVGLTAVSLTATQTFNNTGTWTGNIVGTVLTVTTLTNLPAITAGWLTATGIAADAITAAKIADGAIDRATFAADTGMQTIRSGTAQVGNSLASQIKLDSGASSTDDYYKNDIVYTTGGTGAGQWAQITSYGGSLKIANISPSWATTPDATTTFAILTACGFLPADRTTLGTIATGVASVESTVAAIPEMASFVGSLVDPDALGAMASFYFNNGYIDANTTKLAGQTVTAAAGVTFPASVASPTNITAGTITTLTNLPAITAGWLTATGIAADAFTAAKFATDVGAEFANSLLDLTDGIETSLTPRNALRLIAAAVAGKLSGAGTTTEVIRNAVADSKNRISATVDSSGNRSAITTDLT